MTSVFEEGLELELVVAPEEDLYCFYFLLHLWKELSSDWGQVKTLMGSLFFS